MNKFSPTHSNTNSPLVTILEHDLRILNIPKDHRGVTIDYMSQLMKDMGVYGLKRRLTRDLPTTLVLVVEFKRARGDNKHSSNKDKCKDIKHEHYDPNLIVVAGENMAELISGLQKADQEVSTRLEGELRYYRYKICELNTANSHPLATKYSKK